MPLPTAGFKSAEAAVKASRKQEEQESEYASQENELRQGIVGEQPLRAQVEPESGSNAKQQESDRSAVMVVRWTICRQKFRSAGVQKNGKQVQLRFSAAGF